MTSHTKWSDKFTSLFVDIATSKTTIPFSKIEQKVNDFLSLVLRDLNEEGIITFMNEITITLKDIIKKYGMNEKVLQAIVIIVDVIFSSDVDDNVTKLQMKEIIDVIFTLNNERIMKMAADVLGKILRLSSHDLIEKEFEQALNALMNEPKLNGALIMQQIIINNEAICFINRNKLIEGLLKGVYDKNETVRIESKKCFRMLLEMINSKEVNEFNPAEIYKQAMTYLKQNNNNMIDIHHGALLLLIMLMQSCHKFMKEKFNEILQLFLNIKENKNELIKRTVISSLPYFAQLNPSGCAPPNKRFIELIQVEMNNLNSIPSRNSTQMTQSLPSTSSNDELEKIKCVEPLNTMMNYLIGSLKSFSRKQLIFRVIGDIVKEVKEAVYPLVETLFNKMYEIINPKEKRPEMLNDILYCMEQCLLHIPTNKVFELVEKMLGPLFEYGLSKPLVSLIKSYSTIGVHRPKRNKVQKVLLDVISVTLLKKPFIQFGALDHMKIFNIITVPTVEGNEQIMLALNTLHSFIFLFDVIPMVKECIMKYIDNENRSIRKEAATLIKVLLPIVDENVISISTLDIDEVLEKLLLHALSDEDTEIRLTIMELLDDRFDPYLAQSKHISTLFVIMNDENLKIREEAIKIIGRVSRFNPGYAMPSFRKTTIRLLTQLKHSKDLKTNEEASLLMSKLIKSSFQLIKPYVEPLLTDLLPKLEHSIEHSHSTICVNLLNSIGDLATVGTDISAFIQRIMKNIVTVLQLKGNSSKLSMKKEASLIALGKVSRSTGYVIKPYYDYPELIGLLLDMIYNERNQSIKDEIIKVFGIIGAIDPYRYKTISEKKLVRLNDDIEQNDLVFPFIQRNTEEFYAVTTITLLLNILRDNTFSAIHEETVDTFVRIICYLNKRSLPFIPQILSTYLKLLDKALPTVLPFLLNGLAQIMYLIEKNIREHLDFIIKLIVKNWNDSTLLSILKVICEIAKVMHDEFKIYMPQLLSLIIEELNKFVFEQNNTMFETIMNAICVLSENIDFYDYLHLVIPTISDLIGEEVHISIVLPTLKSLYRFLQNVDPEEYVNRLILPLTRLLQHEELREATMNVFCSIGDKMKKKFLLYVPTIRISLNKHCPKYIHQRYESLIIQLKEANDGINSQSEEIEGHNIIVSEDLHLHVTNITQDNQSKPVSDISKVISVWNTYRQRITREDWIDWFEQIALRFLRESPIQSLCTCHSLATTHYPLVRDLFNYAFLSMWQQSLENAQKLTICLIHVFEHPTTPKETIQLLLNLCEFMEREGITVPLHSLGDYSKKCNSFAKALHYKEKEFLENPTIPCIEEMIGLNNQLQNYDAATGLIEYTKQLNERNQIEINLNQTWYEKLGKWQKALMIYEEKLNVLNGKKGQNNHSQTENKRNNRFGQHNRNNRSNSISQFIDINRLPQKHKTERIETEDDLIIGKLKCFYHLGDWEAFDETATPLWKQDNEKIKNATDSLYAAALWYLDKWDEFNTIVNEMKDENNFSSLFLKTINCIHNEDYKTAYKFIEKQRNILDAELSSLLGENYDRAYNIIANTQMVAELEEVIMFKQAEYENHDRKSILKASWSDKLIYAKTDVTIWQRLLKIRSFVLTETENSNSWIKFTGLCYKNGMHKLAFKTLDRLAGIDLERHLIHLHPSKLRIGVQYLKLHWKHAKDIEDKKRLFETMERFSYFIEEQRGDDYALKSSVNFKLGEWYYYLVENTNTFDETTIPRILEYYRNTILYENESYKYWHRWAMINFEVLSYLEYQENVSEIEYMKYIKICIEAFVKSLLLVKNDQTSQDTLKILTILFKFGNCKEIEEVMNDCIIALPIDIWLHVIPQIIARTQSSIPTVQRIMAELLTIIGKKHPQALVYPLTVASKSTSFDRRKIAASVIEKIRAESGHLVDQALLVSEELVRIAVLWLELWNENLEEISREYYGHMNFPGMMKILQGMIDLLDKGGESNNERQFIQTYGRELKDAYIYCKRFEMKHKPITEKDPDMTAAWEIFYRVYQRIHKTIETITTLELSNIAPRLSEASDLDIAVPGTYKPQKANDIIRIKSFNPILSIIPSKQRPRKLSIYGSDGKEYKYILKGHEDLRQDERVMQLFGLVNDLLANDPETSKEHLFITTYNIIPLSPMSGLIGWVPHSDTLNQLIKEYRESKQIPVDMEKRMIQQQCRKFDELIKLKKVEIFENVMSCSDGMDLAHILWLKSASSEIWLERRTNFTKTVALMSMVGYILGLGDRHPSNLMLQRYTGHVVHIDFGDCFEVAVLRDKFPELVPFRLTRMIVNAMGVSGVEGLFRITCEKVMTVLRENKDSLMAVLEAFVYDPLFNRMIAGKDAYNEIESDVHKEEIKKKTNKALSVTRRVLDKLTGKDFGNEELNVEEQVERLIQQATSNENLAQSYQGWCPYW